MEDTREKINLKQRINYKKRMLKNPNKFKTNSCKDCNCPIDHRAVRCSRCKGKSLRKYKRPYEIGEFIKKCKCGCGENIFFKRSHIYNKIPDYIWGHKPSPRKGKVSERRGKSYSEIYQDKKDKIIDKIKEARKYQVLQIKDTSIEVKIQNFLKKLGVKFFTHQYIKEIEHGYQCDILIPSVKTIIECDGDYWHNYPNGNEIDHIRTKELLDNGFKVIRLWEREINEMSLAKFNERIKNL